MRATAARGYFPVAPGFRQIDRKPGQDLEILAIPSCKTLEGVFVDLIFTQRLAEVSDPGQPFPRVLSDLSVRVVIYGAGFRPIASNELEWQRR